MKSFSEQSDDYKRGFRDGVEEEQRLDDESACMRYLFGGKPITFEKLEDLSPRQIKMLNGRRRAETDQETQA